MKKLIAGISAALLSTAAMAQTAPQLNADNIDEVIAAMTIEEKAQLLAGGGHGGFAGSGPMLGYQERIVPGAAGITLPVERLGIPSTVLADGPAGVNINPRRKGTSQTFYATSFPVGTCLASTWNTELVEQVGKAMGNETLEYGCDVLLAPGMNLHRNPLCGRNFEYYSEDPYLTGKMGAAMTLGIQSQGVGVSAKHFAVNSQETNRSIVDERVSQRALRELYLRGFEIMVKESNPWTIMSSYNIINGQFAQGSHDLLTKILRDEWGFRGIVMTDWIGEREQLPTYTEVQAGNDLLMPGFPEQVKHIIEAVNNGTLDIKDVDRNVHRILEYIVKTPRFKKYQFSNKPDLKAHAAITRQSSTEGMVLLKNTNSTLPVRDLKTVALFGVNSYDFLNGGLGSGTVKTEYVVDMVEGLANAGIKTTPVLTEIYQNYVKYAAAKFKADKNPMMWFLNSGKVKLDEIEISERCINNEAEKADAAIITIGRQAGEDLDRKIEGEFNITETERELISRVSNAFHAAGKRVVVIINSGSVIETASWRDRVDAILCAWQPGMEGGNSVADVLTGKVNPSGRLTMTWPIDVNDHPSTANFPQDYDYYTYKNLVNWRSEVKGLDYTNHEEDIYVGYRYFDTFNKDVAYPFGYGLSYTTFEFNKPTVKKSGNRIEISVTIKNTGNVAGKEVAQVYVTAPKGKIEKPAKELKAFGKTKELKPGESQTLKMIIGERDLASFNEAESQWIVEAGTYTFKIGANVEDIRCTTALKLNEYTEDVDNVLAPKQSLNLLKAEK